MEELEVDGLVIKEVKTGESDKILTILTPTHGKISVTAKGAGSIKNRHAASAQLFSYSTFLLRKAQKYYHIADSFFINSFETVRYDIERLSLAAYLCDIANDLSLEDTPDAELMSLTLNALYALDQRKQIPIVQIKGAYELKAAVLGGFMPELDFCGVCGSELKEEGALDVMNGRIVCKSCRHELENDPAFITDDHTAKIFIRVTPDVLFALRFVVDASVKRFLSFTLDEVELSLFAVLCERYLLNHLEHGFSSLTYYKSITESF